MSAKACGRSRPEPVAVSDDSGTRKPCANGLVSSDTSARPEGDDGYPEIRQRRPYPRVRGSTITPTWVTYRQATRLFLRGVTVPTATRISLVVGTWLSLMNHGQLILGGHPPWVRIVLNYLTPFTVASIGYLAARRHRTVERLIALPEAEGRDPPVLRPRA